MAGSMSKSSRVQIGLALLVFGLAGIARGQLSGQLGAHDPSTLIKDGGNYYYFATGQGIVSRRSSNLMRWNTGATVFSTAPAWTTSAVPGFTGNFWAPDVAFFNGAYHLYYSVSTFGSQVSAIGMATTPTLDTSSSSYGWTDHGPIIQSTNGSAYNTIDPSIFTDTDGSMWMTFGSFWNGVYETELDPSTGLRKNTSVAPKRLAYNSSIEASYLYKRGTFYYLFVNWGQCCMGVNSTYNMRVGRSTSVGGPFVDQNGVNMINSGGSLFLGSEGNVIGPGHMGIYTDAGTDYFTFHYYNGANNGSATYNLEKLYWSANGWPSAAPVPEPSFLGVCCAGIYGMMVMRRRRLTPCDRRSS
jgi:arabinan endo-1,5-alpha-L-arabinosidase